MHKIIFFAFFYLCAIYTQGQTALPVVFTHEGLSLNGRLQLPAGAPPFRAVVIVPGSGANDRDGTIPMYGANIQCLYPGLYGDTLRPYKGLSDALAAAGYAVFTYDKVEYTFPGIQPSAITFRKLWLPAVSAVAWLKTRNDIDTHHMILLGHSEGASFLPKIAQNDPSVKALVSLAGPRTPLDTMIATQLVHIAQTCNGNVSLAEQQGNQIMAYGGVVRSGNYTGSYPPLFGVPAAVWQDYFRVVDSVSILYNGAQRKTLFIGLGDDLNVPVHTELQRFQQEITIPADFYILPGINHYLTTPTHPATSPILTDTILHWLRQAVPPTGAPVLSGSGNVSWVLEGSSLRFSRQKGLLHGIIIYDSSGKQLLNKKISTQEYRVDVSRYTAGIYYVEINKGRTDRQTVKVFLP